MKSNIIKVLCLTAVLFSAGINSQAQYRHFRQSVYLNGVLPTGQFGGSIDATHTSVPLTFEQVGKSAVIGFGAGYRANYRFDIGLGEVAPFIGVDLFWNRINGKLQDQYRDSLMTAPTYLNIPLMAGISYCYDELNTRFPIIPFGEFAVGADMMLITREGTTVKNDPANYFAYKPSFDVAWMLGAGVYLGNYVSVGAYYYGLGKHTVDYTSRTIKENAVARLQVENSTNRETRSVGSVALRIGFHF